MAVDLGTESTAGARSRDRPRRYSYAVGGGRPGRADEATGGERVLEPPGTADPQGARRVDRGSGQERSSTTARPLMSKTASIAKLVAKTEEVGEDVSALKASNGPDRVEKVPL